MSKKRTVWNRILIIILIGLFLLSQEPLVYARLSGSAGSGRKNFESDILDDWHKDLNDTNWEGLAESIALSVAITVVTMGIGAAANSAGNATANALNSGAQAGNAGAQAAPAINAGAQAGNAGAAAGQGINAGGQVASTGGGISGAWAQGGLQGYGAAIAGGFVKTAIYAGGMGLMQGALTEYKGGKFEDGFITGAITGGITGGVGALGAGPGWGAGIGATAGAGVGYLRYGEDGILPGAIIGGVAGFGAGAANNANTSSTNEFDNVTANNNVGEPGLDMSPPEVSTNTGLDMHYEPDYSTSNGLEFNTHSSSVGTTGNFSNQATLSMDYSGGIYDSVAATGNHGQPGLNMDSSETGAGTGLDMRYEVDYSTDYAQGITSKPVVGGANYDYENYIKLNIEAPRVDLSIAKEVTFWGEYGDTIKEIALDSANGFATYQVKSTVSDMVRYEYLKKMRNEMEDLREQAAEEDWASWEMEEAVEEMQDEYQEEMLIMSSLYSGLAGGFMSTLGALSKGVVRDNEYTYGKEALSKNNLENGKSPLSPVDGWDVVWELAKGTVVGGASGFGSGYGAAQIYYHSTEANKENAELASLASTAGGMLGGVLGLATMDLAADLGNYAKNKYNSLFNKPLTGAGSEAFTAPKVGKGYFGPLPEGEKFDDGNSNPDFIRLDVNGEIVDVALDKLTPKMRQDLRDVKPGEMGVISGATANRSCTEKNGCQVGVRLDGEHLFTVSEKSFSQGHSISPFYGVYQQGFPGMVPYEGVIRSKGGYGGVTNAILGIGGRFFKNIFLGLASPGNYKPVIGALVSYHVRDGLRDAMEADNEEYWKNYTDQHNRGKYEIEYTDMYMRTKIKKKEDYTEEDWRRVSDGFGSFMDASINMAGSFSSDMTQSLIGRSAEALEASNVKFSLAYFNPHQTKQIRDRYKKFADTEYAKELENKYDKREEVRWRPKDAGMTEKQLNTRSEEEKLGPEIAMIGGDRGGMYKEATGYDKSNKGYYGGNIDNYNRSSDVKGQHPFESKAYYVDSEKKRQVVDYGDFAKVIDKNYAGKELNSGEGKVEIIAVPNAKTFVAAKEITYLETETGEIKTASVKDFYNMVSPHNAGEFSSYASKYILPVAESEVGIGSFLWDGLKKDFYNNLLINVVSPAASWGIEKALWDSGTFDSAPTRAFVMGGFVNPTIFSITDEVSTRLANNKWLGGTPEFRIYQDSNRVIIEDRGFWRDKLVFDKDGKKSEAWDEDDTVSISLDGEEVEITGYKDNKLILSNREEISPARLIHKLSGKDKGDVNYKVTEAALAIPGIEVMMPNPSEQGKVEVATLGGISGKGKVLYKFGSNNMEDISYNEFKTKINDTSHQKVFSAQQNLYTDVPFLSKVFINIGEAQLQTYRNLVSFGNPGATTWSAYNFASYLNGLDGVGRYLSGPGFIYNPDKLTATDRTSGKGIYSGYFLNTYNRAGSNFMTKALTSSDWSASFFETRRAGLKAVEVPSLDFTKIDYFDWQSNVDKFLLADAAEKIIDADSERFKGTRAETLKSELRGLSKGEIIEEIKGLQDKLRAPIFEGLTEEGLVSYSMKEEKIKEFLNMFNGSLSSDDSTFITNALRYNPGQALSYIRENKGLYNQLRGSGRIYQREGTRDTVPEHALIVEGIKAPFTMYTYPYVPKGGVYRYQFIGRSPAFIPKETLNWKRYYTDKQLRDIGGSNKLTPTQNVQGIGPQTKLEYKDKEIKLSMNLQHID